MSVAAQRSLNEYTGNPGLIDSQVLFHLLLEHIQARGHDSVAKATAAALTVGNKKV